jgi:hypothetical protein
MKTSVKLDSVMKLEEEISFWNSILSTWLNRGGCDQYTQWQQLSMNLLAVLSPCGPICLPPDTSSSSFCFSLFILDSEDELGYVSLPLKWLCELEDWSSSRNRNFVWLVRLSRYNSPW